MGSRPSFGARFAMLATRVPLPFLFLVFATRALVALSTLVAAALRIIISFGAWGAGNARVR